MSGPTQKEVTKVCSKCGEDKSPSGYYKDRKNKNGLRASCTECTKKYNRENSAKKKLWRKENRKRHREYVKDRRNSNIVESRKYERQYHEKNKYRINEQRRERYKKDPDRHKAYVSQYREKNPYRQNRNLDPKEKIKRNLVRRCNKRKITLAQFYSMVNNQGSCCAICYKYLLTVSEQCVDHCHNTNIVRGILCKKCNVMLGLVNDDTIVLENAVKYLNNMGAQQ